MFHLSLRVAWHDNRWNGAVCRSPAGNAFCASLDRIREEKDPDREQNVAGQPFAVLKPDDLPPCKAESGAFMNEQEWCRVFDHPYRSVKAAQETHGHLKRTPFPVPPYSTLAVPFWWMRRENQRAIQESLATPLPADEPPPFSSGWVFGRARQEALVELFFRRLVPETPGSRADGQESLVIFYCKAGHPLGDEIARLIVGVGRLVKVGPPAYYETAKPGKTYPMWDRLIRHSIRPGKDDGFLLPYHDYLEPTGDTEEDGRRLDLLRQIVVAAGEEHVRDFSYAAELDSAECGTYRAQVLP